MGFPEGGILRELSMPPSAVHLLFAAIVTVARLRFPRLLVRSVSLRDGDLVRGLQRAAWKTRLLLQSRVSSTFEQLLPLPLLPRPNYRLPCILYDDDVSPRAPMIKNNSYKQWTRRWMQRPVVALGSVFAAVQMQQSPQWLECLTTEDIGASFDRDKQKGSAGPRLSSNGFPARLSPGWLGRCRGVQTKTKGPVPSCFFSVISPGLSSSPTRQSRFML